MKTIKKSSILSIPIVLMIMMIGCSGSVKEKGTDNEAETGKKAVMDNKVAASIESIPTKQVCMINDAFMGKDQIPVPVNNKVYYGCCEGCVDKLTNMPETRYAIDPFSGEKVDKADAFIAMNPNSGGSVSYFESKENYLAMANM